MIVHDIAEYEDGDSELAKYTISRLHNEIKKKKYTKEQLLEIINHYGINEQQKYIHSEYFELDEAIIETRELMRNLEGKSPKVIEPTIKPYIVHISEEIADVMVMLKQIQYYFNIKDEDIEGMMDFKIKRQLNRIEKEKENKNEKEK